MVEKDTLIRAIIMVVVVIVIILFATPTFGKKIIGFIRGELGSHELKPGEEETALESFNDLMSNIEEFGGPDQDNCVFDGYLDGFVPGFKMNILPVSETKTLITLFYKDQNKGAKNLPFGFSVLILGKNSLNYNWGKNLKESGYRIWFIEYKEGYTYGIFTWEGKRRGLKTPTVVSDKLYKKNNIVYLLASFEAREDILSQILDLESKECRPVELVEE